MFDEVAKWIQEVTRLNAEHQFKILFSALAIFLLWMLRRVVKRIVWYNTENPGVRYRWNKGIGYTYIILLTLILLRVWFRPSWNVMQFLALVSAALTIALQDLVRSFAGWLYLLWKRPFFVGDRIQIDNDIVGDVIDIRAFKFSLNEVGNWVHADQSTGRVMHVPNSVVLNKTITNFTEGFHYIWSELPVLVTFESNWKEAKKVLTEIANQHSEKVSKRAESRLKEASKKYMLFYHKLTPIVYTSVKDCGVLLTLRFLVEPRRRRGCEEAMWEDILDAFNDRKDIDFAYPTQRFYDNATEGKKGLTPPV
ncbi:MAG: mechanosensitive ion channel family protein [Lentisphaerae bacterium]|nr:mechanosensitive ion channel family protein [Lentisphaerota bacterium]MCP4102430.1 mechanosensitive ion channel family protein [Lentisphaerota bacterium]